MKIINRFKNLEGKRKAQIVGGSIYLGTCLLQMILGEEISQNYFDKSFDNFLGIQYDEDESIYSSFSE